MESAARLEALEKMAAFGQLGVGVVHDVKNCLTGIMGFAQVGKRRPDNPEKNRELFVLIEAEAVRCKEMLLRLLELARDHERPMAVVDINAVVEAGTQMFTHRLSMGEVKTEIRLEKDLPPVLAVAAEIHWVLVNLAINALQAMPNGGRVCVSTKKDGSQGVQIDFADNGPGMDEATLGRIFEPFFTTKSADDGTGLGLTMSREIVRAHKGTLSVASKIGVGTTFTIRLPEVSP